jgi:hypothetical protein
MVCGCSYVEVSCDPKVRVLGFLIIVYAYITSFYKHIVYYGFLDM